jgi:NitT/TauT family transport system permease protein
MKTGSPALTAITVLSLIALWEAACLGLSIPEYLLPAPHDVISKIYTKFPVLLRHLRVTALEVALGFAVGATAGFCIAVAISSSERMAAVLYPLLIITQVVPKIALAPLFLIWFGYGILPKIVIAALISFFPIVVNTSVGLVSIEPELLDLTRSLSATRYQVFWKIRLPSALPYIFSALKVSVLFSIVGTITGEFVGANKGLGYLIIIGNTTLDTSLVFAALTLLGLMGILCFAAIVRLQKIVSERYGGAFAAEQEIVSSA